MTNRILVPEKPNTSRLIVPEQPTKQPQPMTVAGTPGFLVDGPWGGAGARNCRSWFLSHFDPSLCEGLGKGFIFGHIYCTSITARLARERLVDKRLTQISIK
jgi:hypothetical protein